MATPAAPSGGDPEPVTRSTWAPGSPGPSVRAILRVVLTVVASALALMVLWRLRTPIGYLVIALFVALVAAAPVTVLSQHMRRGLAIALVYGGIVLVPIGVGAILVPPGVEAASDLVNEMPRYAEDLTETIERNDQLREINANFDVTGKVEDFAEESSGSALGDAPGALADFGAGLVTAIFAVVTILILSMFMVARGPGWTEALLRTRPQKEAVVLRRALYAMAEAVSSYVGGALLQALIAGTAAFVVLTILGVPAPLALAMIVAVFDLIPLIGATIGAFLVLLVTLFDDFPLDAIVWASFAIAYQQFENYVVQPRIQSRAVDLDPFVVVVAALFGGTLFGILGALVAIPTAAAIQIGVKEFLRYRRGEEKAAEAAEPEPEVPSPS
ncbi:MAG TPA: AI-2E family transporter [Solirubrobacterales bacterium]|nr:AI-2E family transporter [Solirubrobacterales bacterium]